MRALSGIRVLDLADESGAYCGRLLADMGADVVKVEPPGGEAARDIGPFYQHHPDRDRSLFFWFYNAGKRSVELEVNTRSGREELLRLADRADVVLTTGTRKSLEARGLDYTRLAARNPRAVVATITGFGLDGPRAEWKSCDTVAQALGGMLFVNGHPGEAPLRSLGPQGYHTTCAHAAIGVMLALLERERSGRGQCVEVSLQECVASTMEHVSGQFHQSGRVECRRGTLHWTGYFRVARCRDGYVLQCSLGDWTSLVEWVKADGKARDLAAPEWEDLDYRRRNCLHLFDLLDRWACDYSVSELVEGAQLRCIPFAAVRPVEALPDDPQLRARRFFATVRHEEVGRAMSYPGPPCVMGARPWHPSRRPPLVGEQAGPAWAPRPIGQEDRSGGLPLPEGTFGFVADRALRRGSEKSTRVLEGVRVLDFTWVVAGPVATRILADHGADVIKVERRDARDLGGRRGGITGNLNRGKRSVVIDVNRPRGLDLVRNLVRQCDVVIDNFSARVMGNWGLDYTALQRVRPDIIALSMSGFGHTGPQRDFVSYGPTLQALCGYTLAMRHPAGEPAGWGFSYSDMAAGYSAAFAVLIALWHRRRTGEGQFIDLSQLEVAAALIGPTLLHVLANGATAQPQGNRSPEKPAAPHGVYRCRDVEDTAAGDRWCAICVFTDEQWLALGEALGRPSWSAQPRFASLAGRLANRDELDTLLEEWTRTRPAEEVMERLQAVGVPAGLVADARDLCERDPHLRKRGYWTAVQTPEGGRVIVDGVPVRLSRTPGRVTSAGPLLGEHTAEVLREVLGTRESEIEELKRQNVLV